MTTTTARRNTYPGTCVNCGQTVAAQAGLLGAKIDGRWTVTHTTCTERSDSLGLVSLPPVTRSSRTAYIRRCYTCGGPASDCRYGCDGN